MTEIIVAHELDEERLRELGVYNWPVWSRETSEFHWTYETPETCYLLRGSAIITPEDGEPMIVRKGDLVTFPRGMSCTWKITEGVRKHYYLG